MLNTLYNVMGSHECRLTKLSTSASIKDNTEGDSWMILLPLFL